MTIQLFPDQIRSIDRLRGALRTHKSVLLQGETGSGKSVMAAYMIANSRAKGLKSAFVVPRRDLLHQMSETFTAFGIAHSFVAAGRPFNPYSQTHICTVGTLANRLDKIQPGIVFYDEAHYGGAQLSSMIAHYKVKGAWSIGLSATPEKTNGQGLDEFYDDLVLGPTIRELIDLKRLSDYRLFAPSRPDLSGISTVAGEYAKGELANFMEHETVLIGDAVKHYLAHAAGKLNITFCTSIKHSQMTAEAFRAAGVPSMHMDGETPDDERRRIASAFARRELMNICSVDLMTFGYDLASASGVKGAVIESISDLRPTKSRPLQRQKIGRALRYKEQPAIILDHSGNTMIHGMPCEEISWTLTGRKKRKQNDERAIAVRQCPVCYFVHAPAPACVNCGHIYPVESRMVENVDGELVELDRAAMVRRRNQGMAETLDDLVALGRSRGMKNPEGWARHVFAGREKKKLQVTLHAGNEVLEL